MDRILIEGENYIHKELWAVVLRQVQHAKNKQQGSFYDHIVAMVFAFNTLEAYLNFVGDRLAPLIWQDERNYFREEPHRGFAGKVKTILELCDIKEPDRTNRPYSSVWLLKELRDLIAHGKPEKFSNIINQSPYQKPSLYREPFHDLVTPENAFNAVEDVKLFIDMIHSSAKRIANNNCFGRDALGGIFQHSTAATIPPG